MAVRPLTILVLISFKVLTRKEFSHHPRLGCITSDKQRGKKIDHLLMKMFHHSPAVYSQTFLLRCIICHFNCAFYQHHYRTVLSISWIDGTTFSCNFNFTMQHVEQFLASQSLQTAKLCLFPSVLKRIVCHLFWPIHCVSASGTQWRINTAFQLILHFHLRNSIRQGCFSPVLYIQSLQYVTVCSFELMGNGLLGEEA